MQGALIQKDSMLYEFTSSDGRLLFLLLGLRIAWYPGLSTPVGSCPLGPQIHPILATPCLSTSQTLAHIVCPIAEQIVFLLLDGFCVFLKVQFHHLSENHLGYFSCTLRTQCFFHPLNSYDIDLSIMLLW